MKIPLLTTILAATVPLSDAQTVLLGWDVNGTSESAASLTYSTIGAHIGSGAPSGLLARGSGAATPGSPSNNTFGAAGFTATDLSGALAANDYFTFSISVAAGFTMSLTSIGFKMSETPTGPTNASLFSSVGGFTSTASTISSWTLPAGTTSDQSIVLSSGSFSNLTGTVEFRIYAFGGGGSTTDKLRFRNLTGDDLIISGTVTAVPEPATTVAIVAGAALVGAALYRRRSRGTPIPARV